MVARPLILLVDDQPNARDSMRELFDSIGCSVITVGTEESALKEIDARHDIDLVVTDINLRGGLDSDKSGVIFARVVRRLRDDLPIAAYSSRARELKVSPSEVNAFVLFLDHAESSADEVMAFVNECKSYAITHREMAAQVSQKIANRKASSSDGEDRVTGLEAAVRELEASVVRKDDLRRAANTIYIFFGVIAGLASIIGLYFALHPPK
jgi:CheY-like chemotaxis protein